MHRYRTRGFTLIEMSIVLLLISLIIGAIIGGRAMMAGSAVHTVIKDSQNYLQAVQMFKTKYNALPGDFTGATARWNSIEATANGNGDGIITTATEGLRAWQHLNLSGILEEGDYTGSGALALETNLPKAHVYDGVGYQLAGSLSVFGINRGNVLLFGKVNTTELTYGALLSKDAQAVDKKIDDGNADEGMILAASGKENVAAGCTDGLWNAAPPVAYDLMDTEGKCYVVFLLRSDNF